MSLKAAFTTYFGHPEGNDVCTFEIINLLRHFEEKLFSCFIVVRYQVARIPILDPMYENIEIDFLHQKIYHCWSIITSASFYKAVVFHIVNLWRFQMIIPSD